MQQHTDQRAAAGKPFLSSGEVVERLGISKATLYAYVSRGLIRSEPVPESPRTRRYRADDVERLLNRQRMRSDPESATDSALDWGSPLMESSVSFISDGDLFYRGQSAVELARSRTFEEVTALLWFNDLDASLPEPARDAAEARRDVLSLSRDLSDRLDVPARVQLMLPALEQHERASFDRRSETTYRIGWDIVQLFLAALTGAEGRSGIARTLQAYWAPGRSEFIRPLDAALILAADHELNASTFTARCIASAGSPVHSAITGGLAALRGAKHGGATRQVDALFHEAAHPDTAYEVLRARLERGEPLPGFGHRLYPHGDPRGAELLEQLRAVDPDSAPIQLANALAGAAEELQGAKPNLDFGLATLSRAMGQQDGTAFALMALGRTVGWVAHVQEEYARDQLIRPRARSGGADVSESARGTHSA